MRAAIVEAFGRITVQDIEKPKVGHEEALVRLTAAGVCHSDVHILKGDWPGLAPPFPLGHEGIGIVEEVGPGAEGVVKVGERVILGLGGAAGAYWCGACEYCLAGKTPLCAKRMNVRGTFGQYLTIWAKALVVLPPEVSDREVSLACGGLTAYSAVKKLLKYGITPGKQIAIVGAAGGLGHYAIQIANAFGYKTLGVDVGKEKFDFVAKLGATPVDVADAEKFVKGPFGRPYGCIVFSPKLAGFELGLKLLRRGGVFVIVGLPAEQEGPLKVNLWELMGKDTLIVTSAVGTVQEMRELVQLAADGKVKTHVARSGKLSEIGQLLDDLDQGKYPGRAIIDNLAK